MGLVAEVQEWVGPAAVTPPSADAPLEQPATTPKAPRKRPHVFTFGRKLLLTFMGFGVISAVIGGTMQTTRSSFTTSVVNPGSTFAVGTLKMDNSVGSCSGVVASNCGTFDFGSSSKLSPGTTYPYSITITNSGTLPATVSLKVTNGQDTNSLLTKTNITIYDSDKGKCLFGTAGAASCDTLNNSAVIAADTYAQIPSSIAINGLTRGDNRWEPGEAHHITFTVETDSTQCASLACDNDTASIDLIWYAVQ